MASVDHGGWIITEDLRGVAPEEQDVGAVSPSLSPQAYLRLADAASAHEVNLEPLIHRIGRSGANATDRFLRDPRLRTGTLGGVMAPVWQAMRGLLSSVRWGRRRARNIFQRSPRQGRPPAWAPAPAPSGKTVNLPEPDRAQTAERQVPIPQKPPQEMTNWQRSHEWTIRAGDGTVLYRGEGIGVEGESREALRARRAPLDQIPGLPRNARIDWAGQPDWSATGVSGRAAMRSARYVSAAHLRRMARDLAVVTRGDRQAPPAAETPAAPVEEPVAEPVELSDLEKARERLRARREGLDNSPGAIEDALARVAARVAGEAPPATATTQPATAAEQPAPAAQATEPATVVEQPAPAAQTTQPAAAERSAPAAEAAAAQGRRTGEDSDRAVRRVSRVAAPLEDRYDGEVETLDPPRMAAGL